MISAPLSTLAHHVYRRPVAPSWLAYYDGADVRVFGRAADPAGRTPDWRLLALQVTQQLTESFVLAHQGVTRDDVDAFDWNHCDTDCRHPTAPYYDAHAAGTVFETMLALRLGVAAPAHAAAIAGIREPSFSLLRVRQAP